MKYNIIITMFFQKIILVKCCLSDVPSPPGIPNVTEVGGDFVNLTWDKPDSDGGSRIQGYWVDKREIKSDTWQRVNVAICLPNQINITNLIEGREYEFRVFAQNEAGLSLPSTVPRSVKVKDPMGKSNVLLNSNSSLYHNFKYLHSITMFKFQFTY